MTAGAEVGGRISEPARYGTLISRAGPCRGLIGCLARSEASKVAKIRERASDGPGRAGRAGRGAPAPSWAT